jgi:hypothetical protein
LAAPTAREPVSEVDPKTAFLSDPVHTVATAFAAARFVRGLCWHYVDLVLCCVVSCPILVTFPGSAYFAS